MSKAVEIEQAAAVEELRAALDAFGAALLSCLQAGLQPADALRACGVELPSYAGPMVNRALASLVLDEEGDAKPLQS